MYRTTNLLACLLFAIAPVALAQQSASSPDVPEDALQPRELIAWSSLQKPQPVPQPMPSPDSSVPEPGPARDQRVQPPADPNAEQAPVMMFTGIIVNYQGGYALATSTGTYPLEAAINLDNYASHTVTITGVLNAEYYTIQVAAIRPLS